MLIESAIDRRLDIQFVLKGVIFSIHSYLSSYLIETLYTRVGMHPTAVLSHIYNGHRESQFYKLLVIISHNN